MENKVMVIGLGPEYNYNPENHKIWSQNDTKYASNHGASLISRTLINFFGADFIDDLDNPQKYRDKYDLCVMSFATHITSWRDVTAYTNFVKELGIKTVAFSLGIQDSSASSSQIHTVHQSMKELLDYVIETSGFIGVRGPYTASLLVKSGIRSKNIIQIGCPTLFGDLNRDLKVRKGESYSNPIIVFHRTMGNLNKELTSNIELLGQDFLDEAMFTDNLNKDNTIINNEIKRFESLRNGKELLENISKNGIFPRTFDEWYQEIADHDFVLGARLHGCIAALKQNIPAVMIARDIRVIEIAEFFKIPLLKYSQVGDKNVDDVFNYADFEEFNELYKYRFDNFIKLLSDLGILHYLKTDKSLNVPSDYHFTSEDLTSNIDIIYGELAEIEKRIADMIVTMNYFKGAINKLKKIPGLKALNRIFNK